jgi:hypothetical protein
MTKRQRPGTGSAAYGALGLPRAAGGGDRAGVELLRHAQGAVRGPDATGRQGARGTTGPRARRDTRSCAHHRDGIPTSVTMSSPSAGAGCGAVPLTARGQPRRWARCAPSLWSSRRGAASRPAARGTWWSAAPHEEPVLAARRPAGGHQGWPAAGAAAAAGEGSRWRGGGRTRWVAQAVCLASTPSRLSWGRTPARALAQQLAHSL